jgi:hypothetical protein
VLPEGSERQLSTADACTSASEAGDASSAKLHLELAARSPTLTADRSGASHKSSAKDSIDGGEDRLEALPRKLRHQLSELLLAERRDN